MRNHSYKNNFKKLLVAVSFDNIANDLSTSALLTGYAIFLGLNEKLISLFLSLRVLFCIFQLFSAPLFSKIGQSKFVVLAIYYASRVAFFGMVFLPLFTKNSVVCVSLFFTLLILNAILAQIDYAPFVNWRMSILQPDDQKKFHSYKTIMSVSIATALNFGLSYILDNLVSTPQAYYIFFAIFLTIFIIATIDFILKMLLDKPPIKDDTIRFKGLISIPLKDKNFRKVLFLTTSFNFALNLGTCFLSLYCLKYLNMSFTYISIMTLVYALSRMLGSYIFARLSIKKKNYNLVMIISLSLIAIMTLSIGVLGGAAYYVMPLIYIIYGFGQVGLSLFESNAIYESAPAGKRTHYVSICKFFVGLSSIIITLVSLFGISANNNMLTFQLVFITASVFALLTLLFFIFAFVRKGKSS